MITSVFKYESIEQLKDPDLMIREALSKSATYCRQESEKCVTTTKMGENVCTKFFTFLNVSKNLIFFKMKDTRLDNL